MFMRAGQIPACIESLNNAVITGRFSVPFDTLEALLNEIGLQPRYDQEGNVNDLEQVSTYVSSLFTPMLRAMAPYVDAGSFITLIEENLQISQLYFDQEEMELRVLPPNLVFPSAQEIADLGVAHELLDSANVPRTISGKVKMTLASRIRVLLEKPNIQEDRTS
jgi:hypothetical protein